MKIKEQGVMFVFVEVIYMYICTTHSELMEYTYSKYVYQRF